MHDPTPVRPDFREVYQDRQRQIRERRRRDRAKGFIAWSDAKIEAAARREAERQVQEAINRWREEKGLEVPELREL